MGSDQPVQSHFKHREFVLQELCIEGSFIQTATTQKSAHTIYGP